MRAVAEGTLIPGERYEQSLKSCLQCLACTEVCGKGLDGAHVILEGRLAQTGKKNVKRRLERFAVCTLLPRRMLVRRTVKIFSFLQKILKIDTSGSVRHIPDVFGAFMGKRSLPNIARKSVFELLPEKIAPKEGVEPCGEVAVFTGCFSGLIRTEAILRLVSALTNRGYVVWLPKAQACCGAPAQLSGFGKEFKKIELYNTKIFSAKSDIPVLTVCATCHRTLAREYKADGFSLSKRIVDAALFLAQHDNRTGYVASMPLLPASALHARQGRPVSEENPLLVAVHDPCHLRLDPKIGQAVRAQLVSKPWIKLIELAERGVCCGGGGVSSLKNPVLADELGAARANAIVASGADVVVSQCPGCVTQLNNHLSRLNAPVRACHVMELIGA